jgi:hypothetical protein
MSNRTYTNVKCPICAWSCNRSYFFPKHIIKKHPADVILSKTTSDHCMYASVADKKDEIYFCVCFTCERGFIGDVMTSQASRWLNSHSKEVICKKEHKAAALAFKVRREQALAEMKVTESPKESITTSQGSVMDIWNTLKIKRDYKDLCIEFENNDKEYYDMDSDNNEEYVFDPAKGILKLFRDASEYKKLCNKLSVSIKQCEETQIERENTLTARIKELEEMLTTKGGAQDCATIFKKEGLQEGIINLGEQ